MEPVVPALLALGGRIGDVFMMRLPFHPVAHPFHTGDKTGLGAVLLHGLIDCSHQPELETAAPCCRPVFARAHGVLSWFTIRLQGFQPVCLTDLVGEGAKSFQILFIELQFQTGFTAYRIYHQMVVPVVAVDVRGDLDLVAVKIFRKLHAHLVDFLRRDRRPRFKGLHILIEIHAFFLPVSALGRHEFLKCGRSAAVLPGHQLHCVSLFILKRGLFVLRHIPHNLGHGRFALRFLLDRVNNCHTVSPDPSGRTGNRTPHRTLSALRSGRGTGFSPYCTES